jgi:hypothetical protein
MDLRNVEEIKPLRHALLKIYVSTALGRKYNDFATHWQAVLPPRALS